MEYQLYQKKMKNKKIHRWNTQHFEKYTFALDRTDLNKLYPSEAWSLYRTISSSKNVLDLGCGNGAMSSICNKINKKIKYFGVDHQLNLIKKQTKNLITQSF